MTNIDFATYKTLYLHTAREHLSDIKKNLSLLNQSTEKQELIYEIFRLFHSLKSQNYFMGFEKTALLCKSVEGYFHKLKESQAKYNTAVSEIILAVTDKFEKSLASIEQENKEIDLSSDIINLEHRLSEL